MSEELDESTIIEHALQELINTRHLYQSVRVDFAPALKSRAREAWLRRQRGDLPLPSTSEEDILKELLAELDDRDWFPVNDKPPVGKTFFVFPPARTLCSVCEETEPFNLIRDEPVQVISLGKKGRQVFSFSIQCQRCKDCVIVVLVKREARKLQLVGRSDFEQVQAPAFIEKGLRKFYSQAVIAYQSGHTLPALFMLRTLIEQHMRVATGKTTLRGDELCDEYSATFPPEMKTGKFPSFKVIYRNLSDALHRADEDMALFESEIENVKLHFETLDLFSRLGAQAKKDGKS